MDAIIRLSACAGLLGYAVYQWKHDSNWWLYTPSYVFLAVVSTFPRPSSRLWKTLSAIAILGGSLFMLFLYWTFNSLDETVGLKRVEAANLLPVSIAVALGTTTRITSDTITKPIHYVRATLLISLLAISVTVMASVGKFIRD